MNPPLRLGILGTARIALLAVLRPAQSLPEVDVVAVASRSAARAKDFARQHGIPESFSYGELVAAQQVEAVYVCCENSGHAHWAEAALGAGKHVLVEKPLCLDGDSFRRLQSLSASSGRVVLEAVMIQHHPWQLAVRRLIENGELGKLRRCHTRISYPISEERLAASPGTEDGGGVTCDTVPYWLQTVQATLGSFGAIEISQVSYDGNLDLEVELETTAGPGVPATLSASFRRDYRASHRLVFARGVVEIPDFFRPNVGKLRMTMRVSRQGVAEPEVVRFEPQHYYANQLSAFAGLCRNGGGDGLLVASGERATALGRLRASIAPSHVPQPME